MSKFIPTLSIERLCLLFRYLQKIYKEGKTTIFSSEIGKELGISAHTIRKDISYLGEIGKTAAGYNVKKLLNHIHQNLGLGLEKQSCLIGLGRLGQALLNSKQFLDGNYRIVAGFDVDINRLEMLKTNITLYPAYRIQEIVRQQKIELAVLAVPGEAAQEVADKCISGGVRGILNFAPKIVKTGVKNVEVRNIDLYSELRILSVILNLHDT